MANWLDKYDEGGNVAKTDATRTTKPVPQVLMTEEQKKRAGRRAQAQRAHDTKELAKAAAKKQTYISAPSNMTAELKAALSEDQKRDEYINNSPFAQTLGSFTPSGDNPVAGGIAADQLPYVIPATAAAATVGPEVLPLLQKAGAAMNTPIAGISALTGNNIVNAGFAARAIQDLPDAQESFDKAKKNPSIWNITNATGNLLMSALDLTPITTVILPPRKINSAIGAYKNFGLKSALNELNPIKIKKGPKNFMTGKPMSSTPGILGTLKPLEPHQEIAQHAIGDLDYFSDRELKEAYQETLDKFQLSKYKPNVDPFLDHDLDKALALDMRLKFADRLPKFTENKYTAAVHAEDPLFFDGRGPYSERFFKQQGYDLSKLNPQERALMSAYQYGYDGYFNNRPTLNNIPTNLKNYFGELSDQFNTAVQKNKITKDVTLNRSVGDYVLDYWDPVANKSIGRGLRSELQVGDVYKDAGFMSTSLPHYDYGGGKYTDKIIVPGGGVQSYAFPNATSYGQFMGEQEVILPKGLIRRVEDVPEPGKVITSILNPYKNGGQLDKYQNNGWTVSPAVAAYNKEARQTPTNIDANAMRALEEVTSYPQRKITEWISGTNQYPSQAMGIQNPYGAFAVDAVADPVNLVGAGLLGKAAKASTKTGVLSKAYKLNPFAKKLNSANKSYRVAGFDALEDFKNTGVVRSVTPDIPVDFQNGLLGARPTKFPSFQKGYADMYYLPKEGGVVFETNVPTFKRGQVNPVTGNKIKGSHYAHRPIDMTTGKVMREVPAENIKVYDANPHWLQGYKPIKENGGWLDKYNDGGPVQENYNDYSVSAPEGFQGDGYSNVGRNYSPAWGGQFAMGGSMPGSVGFTYARTNDPAPSNGPYAKKTMASAQNGTTVPGEYELMQEPDDQINYDSENPAFDAASMLISQGLINSIPEANSPAIDINFNQKNLLGEHTFTHQPGWAGISDPETDEDERYTNRYMLKRTVSPYTTDEDVRLNTQMPSRPQDVNFISNYANSAGYESKSEYPTKVPYEGEKHWNIDRFAIDPEFSSHYPDLENTKEYTDKTQQRRNTLTDMYKYFMLQNKGDRDVAWKQANEFMTKEIDPRISGPVYDVLHNSDPLGWLSGSITSMIPNEYRRTYDSLLNEAKLPEEQRSYIGNEFLKNPASPKRVKDLAMDWLVNYKKMSPKEAETHYNKLPKNEKEYYKQYLKSKKNQDKSERTTLDLSSPGNFQNGGEMKYYQEGLDWKPKTISANGSSISGEEDDIEKRIINYNNSPEGKRAHNVTTKVDEIKQSGPRSKEDLAEIGSKAIYHSEMAGLKSLDFLASTALNTVFPPYLMDKPEWLRKETFKAYRPTSYPDAKKAIENFRHNINPERDDQGNLDISEEAWSKALALGEKPNYIVPSKYKPANAKDPNAKYYTLKPGIIDQQKIIDFVRSPEYQKNKRKAKDNKTYVMEVPAMHGFINDDYLKYRDKNKLTDYSQIDPIQGFQIYNGWDPVKKKNYAAIYDKYDFDASTVNSMIKPYEFYDKFYYKDGGPIKDDRGQWAHPGEVTEIGSNQITMQGVPYPVLGISDTGDTQMMYPNQEYQYKGSSVTEYPMAQDGITTPPSDLYYGPRAMKFCKGKGCAEIATTGVANLLGVDRESLSPQDAWYKKAAVLKNKGKEVWNKDSKDYSGIQAGDFISLDRTGMWHAYDKSKVPGYTLKDNEGNEHLGFIVGHDPKTGLPLVEHGSESGHVYVQPINELSLPDLGFEYSPMSVYRSASAEGKKPVNPRFYTQPGSGIPINWASKTAKPTENDKRYIAALNSNSGKQQMMLGLTPTENKYLNDLSYGIFHNETEGGESKTPIGGSMIAAAAAHELGKLLPSFINRHPTSASLGDVQFKYDDELMNADGTISKVGRYMNDLGVDRDGLYSPLNHRADYNDEVNAVASKLANDYQKIKKNPKKYQYNPETNTVYGDIPVGHALLAAYNLGPSALSNPKKIKDKQNYINNAYKHIMNLNTELMGTLPEVTVTAKKTKKGMEQGGQLTKLDQLTNFTNYNTKQPGGWLDKYQD
jgi:hypothetical protein